jgi:pyrimidine operon attenuation protein/uracil phosphoribosyltransferase
MQLAEQLRPHVGPDTALIGIHSGGVWIAERLCRLLGIADAPGTIDVSFYRDDFAEKGLHPQIKPSSIPFDVEGRHIVLVDDVLYTGRTTRAALNEIFDYGRPARVELAVLADRGGRELPVAAQYNTWDVTLGEGETLVLARDDAGHFSWRLDHE